MSQDSNGLFNVTCLNGRFEKVNAQSIRENLVCNMDNQSSYLSKAVTCTGNERMDQFYVTRISDGEKFGDWQQRLSLKTCQQLVKDSTSELICTGSEFMDQFYITRISNGEKFGDWQQRLSLKTCQKVLKASTPELICTGSEFMDSFDLTRISDKKKLGNTLSLETCLQFSKSNGG